MREREIALLVPWIYLLLSLLFCTLFRSKRFCFFVVVVVFEAAKRKKRKTKLIKEIKSNK